MYKSKKYTNEEIELLSSSPYVKNIRQNRLAFTYEFRCILYDEWIKQPSTFQIRETLKSYGFDCSMLSSKAISKINDTFRHYGRPTNGKNKVLGKHDSIEKYSNVYLIDSRVFVKSRNGINFSSEFINNAYKEYPSVSIESLLESYGLNPEKVGYQRIYKLKKKLENGEKTKEKISADAVEKYSGHPYIKRCTAAHFTLVKQFYDESLIFISYHIDEILRIYEIDGSDLPIRVRNKIGYIGDENYSRHPFWDWASGNYSRVIVVPGNHEFYKMFDIDKLYNGWSLKIRENITCHYNAVIPLGNDIELIATTLWSHILLQDAYETEAAITDFRRMRYGSEPLDWTRFNDEHSRCFRFLEQSVKQSTARHLIVATHHVPSFELMAPEFKGSPLNGAFTVELGGFIADSPIEYWIYGHSHRNINKVIGNTRCICNQLGYVFSNEHTSFDKEAHISI